MSQMKGQDRTPEKQLNEVETGNIPEKEFRIMIMKMIQGLVKTMEKMQELFTKDLQELKNKQMNNTVEEINSRLTETENQINYMEDRMVEITATNKEYRGKNEKKRRQPKKPLGQH